MSFSVLKSVNDFLTVNDCAVYLIVNESFYRCFASLTISLTVNKAPLTIVKHFLLTPLIKFKTLTNGNLKK